MFSLNRGMPCHGVEEVLNRYTEAARNVVMSGPTSFSPLIRRAVEIVKETGQVRPRTAAPRPTCGVGEGRLPAHPR